MKEVARRVVELFHQDAERGIGIELLGLRTSQGNEVVVGGRGNAGVLQLIEQSLGGVTRKTDIHREELLIEDRRTEEPHQLLLFDGITRKNQSVPEAGEDKTSDAALEGLKESNLAFGEIESDVRLADLNAVLRRDGIDRLAVDLKGIESCKNLARGGTGGRRIGRSSRPQGR